MKPKQTKQQWAVTVDKMQTSNEIANDLRTYGLPHVSCICMHAFNTTQQCRYFQWKLSIVRISYLWQLSTWKKATLVATFTHQILFQRNKCEGPLEISSTSSQLIVLILQICNIFLLLMRCKRQGNPQPNFCNELTTYENRILSSGKWLNWHTKV